MKDATPMVRPLADNEIQIKMNRREVKRAFNYLGEQLAGKIKQHVVLDTNNYRTFFSHFTGREYRYELTWNEALRLHSYLRFYIDRDKKNKISISMSQIRNFPIYGLNVNKEF